MSEHTPAPWVYENGHGVIACGNPLKIAGRTKVAKANRALIAAAPELLAVLVELVGQRDAHFHTASAWDAARAAIEKATSA